MSTVATLFVGLVALVHVYILVLEMFLWDKPAGLRAFNQTLEQAGTAKCWPQIKVCTTASLQLDCYGALASAPMEQG